MSRITEGAYVIVRTQSAGVFAGYLAKREGTEVTLTEARRLWYWSGPATETAPATATANN